MCVCVRIAHEQTMEKGIRSPRTGTEIPNMGAGNQTHVHWKGSKLF